MPRSPLTETYDRVKGMVEYVRKNLNPGEYDLFLDMIAPEPQPEAKPAKKTRKKNPSRTSNIPLCVACGYAEESIVHKQRDLTDYHQFQSPAAGKKSVRAAGLGEQIKKAGPKGFCVYKPAAGTTCNEVESNSIHHDTVYADYHPFTPAASPAPNPLSANGAGGATTANSETGQEDASNVHRAGG